MGQGRGKNSCVSRNVLHPPACAGSSVTSSVSHPCHQPPATDRVRVRGMSSALALKAHPGMPLLVLRKKCSCKELETKNIV